MINEKTLPVTYQPITTYQAFAATLSIIYSHEEAYDWLLNKIAAR